MTRLVFIIGIGGFLGTIARYLSSLAVYKFYPSAFPIGTLVVNVLGCFLIGIFYALFEKGNTMSPEWRLFLTTGFCGGFTTFSAFSAESVYMINNGQTTYAVIYSLSSLLFGIAATFVGLWVMKAVL